MAHSDPIRWGILATGGIAASFAEDLALVPDAQTLAVGSRSLDAALAFADRFGIARSYGSWRELAEDTDIDVVYVATPHSAHHAASLVCLRAGRAVLCEKPLTLDTATATELVTTARTAGLFFMEAMWMRTNPAIRRVRELVDDGAIGEVTHVTADFGIPGPVEPGQPPARSGLGGGALLDLGVYPVSSPTCSSACRRPSPPPPVCSRRAPTRTPRRCWATSPERWRPCSCGLVGDTAQRATITGTRGRIEVPRHFFRPDGFTLVPGRLRAGAGRPAAARARLHP